MTLVAAIAFILGGYVGVKLWGVAFKMNKEKRIQLMAEVDRLRYEKAKLTSENSLLRRKLYGNHVRSSNDKNAQHNTAK